MHTLSELINNVKTHPDFHEIVYDMASAVDSKMHKVKMIDEDLYHEIMLCAYVEVNGEHFDEYFAKKAVKGMLNFDGTKGEHWDYEQTTNVARAHGVKFDEYNAWDWYYVMNMLYSDMGKIFGKDIASYVKIAEAWLDDEDVSPGKAFRYYIKVVM